eukprot:9269163-Pyramimonas_sp.AAC.1
MGTAVNGYLQARLSMLHGGGEWESRRDDLVLSLGFQAGRAGTRARTGRVPIGMRPWRTPFELVGGKYWYHVFEWTEAAWV